MRIPLMCCTEESSLTRIPAGPIDPVAPAGPGGPFEKEWKKKLKLTVSVPESHTGFTLAQVAYLRPNKSNDFPQTISHQHTRYPSISFILSFSVNPASALMS